MMPSASSAALTLPSTWFVFRSKTVTEASWLSEMNPRPALGTMATPWFRRWPGMSATVLPLAASRTIVWVLRGT